MSGSVLGKPVIPIHSVRVETDEQVETLRMLRNLTRHGFSHDTNIIESERQQGWWATMSRLGWVKAWLYERDDHVVVGYGLLRMGYEAAWWNSLAVDPHFQGHGYGSFITHDLLNKHHGQVFSSVKRNNPAAVAMHHRNEWECIDGPDDTLIYFRSRINQAGMDA